MLIKFWLESLTGRDNSEEAEVDGRTVFKQMLAKWDLVLHIGFILFRTRTDGGVHRTRCSTLLFHKKEGIS